MIKQNPYADAVSTICIAMFPFITLGALGNEIVLYISLAIAAIAGIGLVVNVLSKDRLHPLQSIVFALKDLGLAYASALSSIILIHNGIDASYGLWFALILSIASISANALTKGEF